MNTPAIITSLSVIGSIAYASGQDFGSTRSSVTPSIRPQRSAALMAGVPCLPPNDWFRPDPGFFASCEGSFVPRIGAEKCALADVDDDGRKESFDVECDGYFGTRCIVDGSAYQEDAAARIRISLIHVIPQEGGVRLERQPVFELDSMIVGQALLQHFPGLANASVSDPRDQGLYAGWADVDRDGDQDLVLQFFADYGDGNSYLEGQIWFENIGYQHSNRVAADINGDGRVDGADLGTVLSNWGPVP